MNIASKLIFWMAMSWYFEDSMTIVFPIFTKIMKRISRILTFRSYCCSLENRRQSCSKRKLKAKQLDSVTRKRWKICRDTVKNHKWVMQFTERMLLNTFTNQLRRSCKLLSHKTSRQIAAVYCLHFSGHLLVEAGSYLPPIHAKPRFQV